MSGGQVVTGIDVGGDINFELARGRFFDDFFEAGMMKGWSTELGTASGQLTLTPDPTDPQKATITLVGDTADIDGNGNPFIAGDVLEIREAGKPPVLVTIITVDTGTALTVATARDQPALSGITATLARPAYLDIGATPFSKVVSKAYKDVPHGTSTDEHSQRYTGELVSGFAISAAYGSIVTGSYSLVGNGYKQEFPSLAQQIVAGGGKVEPATTTLPLNASIDVPVVTAAGLATEFCIESFDISLDNGLSPQNCIGKIAPRAYSPGTASISINASIYLGDTSYDEFMPGKLTQEPIALTFVMRNRDGGYAFQLPAVQLSFSDPSSGGANQQVMIDASGVAMAGAHGESALRIYQLT